MPARGVLSYLLESFCARRDGARDERRDPTKSTKATSGRCDGRVRTSPKRDSLLASSNSREKELVFIVEIMTVEARGMKTPGGEEEGASTRGREGQNAILAHQPLINSARFTVGGGKSRGTPIEVNALLLLYVPENFRRGRKRDDNRFYETYRKHNLDR